MNRRSDIHLYPHQQELVDSIIHKISTDKQARPVAVGVTSFGKSLCIAELVERIHKYPNQRVLILVPNKELVEQNESEIKAYNPDRRTCVYSASVNRKEVGDTTIATIGSIKTKANIIKPTVVIIDECDIVSTKEKSMYQRFFSNCPASTRYCGLTGTPFRLKEGLIYEGDDAFFNCMTYDSSSTQVFNELTNNGFLARIKTKQSLDYVMGSQGVKKLAGDFSIADLSAKYNKQEITQQIVESIVTFKEQYKHMLIFCIDIAHAESTTQLLNESGIRAKVFHSEMDSNRDRLIKEFKNGEIQALVNVDILTRGFSFKELDFIALLRNTKSQALFRQIVGRLLRVHPNKSHGLFLDFTDTSAKLGCINEPVNFNKKKKGGGGDAITKVCPDCGLIVAPAVRFCPECEHEFVFKPTLKDKASNAKVVKEPIIEIHQVHDIKYSRHKKKDSPDSVKVSYTCGMRIFNEWIPIEHEGYARNKAIQWLADRNAKAINVDEILYESKQYPIPKTITVDETDKYPRIINYGW